MEGVTYPFSSKHSQPRNWTEVFCIPSGFFTNWAIREAHIKLRQSRNNKYGILPLRYCNYSQNLLVLIPDHVCTIFMYFKQIYYITQKLLLLYIVIFNFIMLLFSLLNVCNFHTGSLLLGKYWTPLLLPKLYETAQSSACSLSPQHETLKIWQMSQRKKKP